MGINQNSVLPDGEKLRRIRIANGDTQESLAQKAGYAKSTIERVEKGKPALITTLNVIAQALKVDVSSLLAEDNDKHELILKTDTFNYLQPIEQGITDNWINLYRKNLIEDLSLPLYHIPLKCLQINFPQDDFDDTRDIPKLSYLGYGQLKTKKFVGNPLPPNEIIKQHKNILLTGDSGTGKTTELRFLANYYLSQNMEYIPFYIELEDFVPFLFESLNKFHRINLPELFGRSVTTLFFKKNSYSKLIDSLGLSSFKQCQDMLSEDLFNRLAYQLSNWFETKGISDQKVLLLIDDLNKINPFVRNELINQLNSLFQKPCKVVVTCRSNIARMILKKLYAEVKQYELQEVSDEQILSYLKRETSGNRQRIFESNIESDPLLHSMAKNPFYLFLIAEKIKRSPAAKIPSKRSKLIEDFILNSIERKHKEGIYSPVGLTDDMVYVVLPKVAKWFLNQMTKGKNKQLVSFLDSKEFKDIQSPSGTLNTLQIGEKYGLLRFSGLLEESSERHGYPAFLHDNFRDFFAALYLQSMDQSKLMQQLSEIVEYYSWDEPLLFLLELSHDKDVCRQIAEFVLSKDAVLAGMCARHANIMERDLCVQIANAVSKLPTAFDRSLFICKIVPQDNILLQRLSATYALERLSVPELVMIAQDKSMSPSLRQNAWISIPANVGQDDFGFLKDLWNSLPKNPGVEVSTTLVGIAKIPTYEAFVLFTKAYKDIHTLPGFSTTDPMFGFPILALIAYSPTLSQALTAFSAEESPAELSVLISLVQKITTKELPLLEELISHRDVSVATDASKLLVKVLGGKAVPALLKRLESLEHLTDSCEDNADIFAKWHHNEIRNTLLSLIVQLAPDIASGILVGKLKKVKNISSFTDLQTASDERYSILRLLADTRTIAALDCLVSYACNSFNCELADYCADLLEMWPDRTAVLGKLKDYTRNGYPLNAKRAKLLSVRLGADEFCSEAISIFEDLFSHTVLGHEFPAPTEGLALQFYQEDPKPWQERCFEQALSMQPLAVRAMREIQRSEIADQVFKIIEWQCSTLNKKAIKIGLVSGHTSFSLLVECLLVLSHFASIKFCVHIIECFINSQCLINLSELITLRDGSFQFIQYHKKISSSILVFCESVPEKYVPLLFSAFSRLHQECINRISSDKSIDLEPISNILLSLCRRTDDNLVVDLLCSFKNLLCQNKKRDCQINILSLMEAIKLIRGRRFLDVF